VRALLREVAVLRWGGAWAPGAPLPSWDTEEGVAEVQRPAQLEAALRPATRSQESGCTVYAE